MSRSCEYEPAAAMPERVEHRTLKAPTISPEEFQVWDANQRIEADRAEIDADIFHPEEERGAGERERQTRGEPQHEHDKHAPVEEHRCRAQEALGEARPIFAGSPGHRHCCAT
jgi:hypothetical protein